jgi:hypothetical protein
MTEVADRKTEVELNLLHGYLIPKKPTVVMCSDCGDNALVSAATMDFGAPILCLRCYVLEHQDVVDPLFVSTLIE